MDTRIPLANQLARYVLAVCLQIAAVAVFQFLFRWGLVGMLLHPYTSVIAAYFLLRPRHRVPADAKIVDWGRTLGHSWVSDGRKTWFVSESAARELATDAHPPEPAPGFELKVPLGRHGNGLPSTVGAALRGTAVLLGAACVGGAWSAATASIGWLAMVGSFLVLTFALWCIQTPSYAALLAFHLLRRPADQGVVKVTSQRVQWGEKSFTLGQPDERIRTGDGWMVLESGEQKLVLRGANATIRWLAQHLEARSRAGGRGDVPEAMRRMQDKQPG